MGKDNVDISKIPTEELVKDLNETIEDIAVCKTALEFGITRYSGGSVEERLASNRKIKEVIIAELSRRIPVPITLL